MHAIRRIDQPWHLLVTKHGGQLPRSLGERQIVQSQIATDRVSPGTPLALELGLESGSSGYSGLERLASGTSTVLEGTRIMQLQTSAHQKVASSRGESLLRHAAR